MKKNFILVLLILLFLAPSFSAVWFYTHPALLKNHVLTNKGQLMNTPILIKELIGPDKHWKLVYITEKSCDRHCLSVLEQLAKVRLSLGRHLYGLTLHLLLLPGAPELDVHHFKQFNEADMKVTRLTALPNKWPHSKIWLVNDAGLLVMTYEENMKAQDLFHDLHLLARLWEKQ